MTDTFNLRKHTQSPNTHISDKHTKQNTSQSKDTSCSENGNNQCDYVITDGLNIGWIWNTIGDISTSILKIIGAHKDIDTDNQSKQHTNKDQQQELNKIMNTYSTIQKNIIYLIVLIIIITLIYELIKKNEDNDDEYFSIVNICYFFRELIDNPDKYNVKMLLVFTIIFFLIGNVAGLITFLVIVGISWIIIGNFMFEKKNTILFSVLIICGILVYGIIRSTDYYIKRIGEDDPNIEQEKQNAIVIGLQLSMIIFAIGALISVYIMSKEYTIETKTEKLSEYLEKNIFNDITKDQQEILTKIETLEKEYITDILSRYEDHKPKVFEANPNDGPTAQQTIIKIMHADAEWMSDQNGNDKYKKIYNYYIKQLLDASKVKDQYIRDIIDSYQTKTYTPTYGENTKIIDNIGNGKKAASADSAYTEAIQSSTDASTIAINELKTASQAKGETASVFDARVANLRSTANTAATALLAAKQTARVSFSTSQWESSLTFDEDIDLNFLKNILDGDYYTYNEGIHNIIEYSGKGLNDQWTPTHMILDFFKSIGCRTLEVLYLTIGQAVCTIINYFKLLLHFIFNNPDIKPESIDEVVWISFKKSRLLSSGLLGKVLLTHKRLSKMFSTYLIPKVPVPEVQGS
jgi:hypothetical protein